MSSIKGAIQNYFAENYTPYYGRFLENLKPGGAENLKALCPFHDDQNPSLSISIKDGRFNCKACGAKGDAFSFYALMNGIDVKADFPEVLRGIAEAFGIQGGNGTGKSPARRLVKTYDYTNAAGNVLFRKNRYAPKGFSLCRPDGSGGWTPGMGGIEPLLYRLPEVAAAAEVWLVEGEKDADALAALGFAATTNFDGAGKWRESYSETLRGKRIFILPDNDDPGRAHAVMVARNLHGKAKSVKVIILPGVPEHGGDVSDFINGIGDPETAAEALSIMVEYAAEWAPPAEAEPEAEGKRFGASSCGCEPRQAAGYHLTDIGNGQRFADQHRNQVRYSFLASKWLVWDGRRWKPDNEGTVRQLAKQTTRSIYAEAAREPDSDRSTKIGKWAAASESSFRQEAMLKLAQSEPGIPVLPEQLDTDPWLLNVLNGTVDLRTGELRPHRKADLITKLAPVEYNPDAFCPRWQNFLETVTNHDAALVDYLCRVAGYALTGDAGEQCLFVLHGTGQNGKSTFLNVLQAVLDDYALQTGFDTFTIKKNEGIRNDIARMRSARMVVAIETGDGKRLDEQVIKQLTGGDKVTARFLHQEFFEYRPQFKVLLAANHKPTIYGQDHAIWRRIRLIPFTVKIPQDQLVRNYERVLLEEKQGILKWMVFGCREWQRIGLADPDRVKAATERYRSEMDVLEDFIDARCVLGDDMRVKHGDLYAAYESWCEDYRENPFKTRTLAKMLESRGFTYTKPQNTKLWQGIGLKA